MIVLISLDQIEISNLVGNHARTLFWARSYLPTLIRTASL